MKCHERIIEKILFLCALFTVIYVTLIIIFIFKEGINILDEVTIKEFILGQKWLPTRHFYGLLPMIMGTFYVTTGALIIGVPVGVACSIFLAEIASDRIINIVKPAIELLAGIPSVIYGFFGLVVIVPFLRNHFPGNGLSIFAASIVLGIMILPTIINISQVSIDSVPVEYKEGSLALGASKWQTIVKVIIPSAKSGIITSIVLGLGRAVGETMAVIMVIGNRVLLPDSIFNPATTITGIIAIDMSYASGYHQKSLFAAGIVLFIFIMILNIIMNLYRGKLVNQ